MPTQTLMFVAIPNGVSSSGKLKLSVVLSPRLQGASTLQGFPDFLHWASLVKSQGLSFTFASGAESVAVAVDRSPLRPEIWNAVFPPHSFVEAYRIPRYDKRLLVSYPARAAMSYLKYAYQQVALQPFPSKVKEGRGLLGQILEPLIFRDGHNTVLYKLLPEFRVELWKSQARFMVAPNQRGLAARAAAVPAGSAPPDGIPTSTTLPANARDMALRFALLHRMKPAYHRKPLPRTEADFKKVLDFHKALSAINSYPALQRTLGVVFDVEVPAAFAANSPGVPGGPYLNLSVSAVNPGFAWNIAPQLVLPQTAYFRAGKEFTAAPATTSADMPGHKYVDGDVIEGLLALLPEFFHLNQVDVDGGMLKAFTLADNVALVETENLRNQKHPVDVEQVLPSLRSGGIALMADNRAEQLLQSIRDNLEFDAALQGGKLPRPFVAPDLVRGYRLDIWSSQTNQWHSLHRRHSAYRFGAKQDLSLSVGDEEGFTQLAASSPAPDPTRKVDPVAKAAGAPQPGSDMFLHERVALWNGWSLSVQRPGKAINRSADPAKSTDPDPTMNQPITPFKMTTSFLPVKGSLPKLRYGARYRLRARAVDLAGNSVPHNHKSAPELAVPADLPLPFLRFEPVVDPILLLRETLRQGASLERLVIRSYNTSPSLDQIESTESDQRHVLPPRTTEKMAEQHGMFDDAHGKLSGDRTTYEMIATRDAAELPQADPGGPPMDAHPQAGMPYLPDPFSRGTVLRNLPNTSDETYGQVTGGKLHYAAVKPARSNILPVPPGSVTFIDFGTAWPERKPFRLVLKEGKQAPHWDPQGRVLTLYIRKGEMLSVPVSSYMNADDLSVMGVWDWLRQILEAAEVQDLPDGPVPAADYFGELTRLTLEGGHPMITPSKPLLLVHATLQPVGKPAFTVLPIVHAGGPSPAPSALPNAFAPITAWRTLESHDAALLGALRIHGNSTSKVDVEGYWLEYVDDPTVSAPLKQKASAHVEKLELPTAAPGLIYSDSSQNRPVGTYIPQNDVLWFSAPSDALSGMNTPPMVAAPLHRFSDTKHRLVRYQAVSSSRFREYFPNKKGQKFTRSSARVVVNVPSSARPSAPEVAYVLPVFASRVQESTNVKTDIRSGNSLRVYLQRPWYSSGERELLGVVLWPGGFPPDTPTREKYKSFFTQWGLDPIWKTGDVDPAPTISTFPDAVATAQGLTLEETDLKPDVAGHCVAFSRQRKLWYCDIAFENASAYMPFVRLALARYQPHSLFGVELSHVVLADFCQLTPDRSATVTMDPADGRVARVFVGGSAPDGPQLNTIEVTVERRMKGVISDVGWEQAPADIVTVTQDPPGSGTPDKIMWAGTLRFAQLPKADQFRVVVREYESLSGDPPTKTFQQVPSLVKNRKAPIVKPIDIPIVQRLVYAAIVPYNFPAKGTV